MKKLTDLFCHVDDFCKAFLPQRQKLQLESGKRKRNRKGRMSESEIMTIVIAFHMSHQRDFKNYYLGIIHRYYKNEFPTLLSYTRFLEVMPSVLIPLSSFFTHVKGEPTGIEFIDSTSIKVCHNLRIPRHKVFKGTAARGKGITSSRTRTNPRSIKLHNGYVGKLCFTRETRTKLSKSSKKEALSLCDKASKKTLNDA